MTPERGRLLADLLREMREQDRGFFPEEAWTEIHRSFAIPYVEVLLTRRAPDGRVDVFLTRRGAGDPVWPGRPWHIPGGMWRVGDTLEQACRKVAKSELGIEIGAVTEIATFKWPDHPVGNPISHICVCEAAGTPAESEDARYVPAASPGEPMLRHHGEFLKMCAEFLAS